MTKDIRQQIDAIFRPDRPKRQKFLAGMRRRAKEMDARFFAKARRQAQVRALLAPSLNKLRQQLDMDAKTLKKLKALGPVEPRKRPPPKIPKQTDRIFSGSIGATLVPPYDLDWTWSQQQGGPDTLQTSADANSGTMAITNITTGATASASTAVGIWLIPPLGGGSTMTISAAPTFSWAWYVGATFNYSESDGWINVVVGSFDRHSGVFIGNVVDPTFDLWGVWQSFLGWGSDDYTTTGYPLQVMFTATEGVYYAVWIQFSTYAQSGDMAEADFSSITVPSMTWANT
jgi:hypothetical protein